jgi:hypothetical protein
VALSSVEIAERSASHRALREMIGRQLRAEYDTSHPLPDHLLGLLHRLNRDEEKPWAVAAVFAKADHIRVQILAAVQKNRSNMAVLLSHLRDNKATLRQAIDAARETREGSQRRREMRQPRTQSFTAVSLEA